jgi:hypothetical protein
MFTGCEPPAGIEPLLKLDVYVGNGKDKEVTFKLAPPRLKIVNDSVFVLPTVTVPNSKDVGETNITGGF